MMTLLSILDGQLLVVLLLLMKVYGKEEILKAQIIMGQTLTQMMM